MSKLAWKVRPGFLLSMSFLAACAGKPPLVPEADAGDCPDLTGSYRAFGSLWEKGELDGDGAYLPYYLGVPSVNGWQDVDRVDIDGANDGTLGITLRVDGAEFSRVEIPRSDLVCDRDRLAIQMGTVPWGGGGPVLALGASAGWRVIRRDDDGALSVEQLRRETGTIMLVIPFHSRSKSSMRFLPHEQRHREEEVVGPPGLEPGTKGL